MSSVTSDFVCLSILVLCRYNGTFRKKQTQHICNCIKTSARVVSQVDNKTLHSLLFKIIQRFFKLVISYCIKLRHFDIANLVLLHLIRNCLHFDRISCGSQFQLFSVSENCNLYICSLFPFDPGHHRIKLLITNLMLIDFLQDISGFQSCFLCRRVFIDIYNCRIARIRIFCQRCTHT